MKTVQTSLAFLARYSADQPWEVAFVSPESEEVEVVTVGSGGEVEAGPRLSEVLRSIEKSVDNYPRYIDQKELKACGLFEEGDLIVKTAGDMAIYVEVGVKTHRLFKKQARVKLKGIPTEGNAKLNEDEAFGNPDAGTDNFTESDQISAQSVPSDSGASIPEKQTSRPTEVSPTKTSIEIRYEEPETNRIDIPPYDDRLEEVSKFEMRDRVRIGDVILIIPPLAIQVNRKSSLQKVKTLRSKSSIITKAGSNITTITLQLYFHDLESINGRKVKAYGNRYYYMDGLRPLIAQFKKAPFLPIDNEYINNVLGIHSVALVDLTVTTVPGFPHSLAATLTLAKFDHRAYMPQVEFLGDVIHYPMLRWYYQESLREPKIVKNGKEMRNPFRTYLEPIEGEITNDLVFQIADEEQLIARQNALNYVLSHPNPEELMDKLSPDTEIGKQYLDGQEAKIILDQYKRYQELKKKGMIPSAIAPDLMPDEDRIWMGEPANEKGQELYHMIYGDKVASNNGSFFHPPESYIIVSDLTIVDPMVFFNNNLMPFSKSELEEYGYASFVFHSSATADQFSSDLDTEDILKSGLTEVRLFILMTPENVKRLEAIVNKGNELYEKYVGHAKDLYEQNLKIIEQTELDLKMHDVPISGLIPTSLSVMYENQFSMVQVQDLDTPTLQYLGCQDPYISVSFEANETAVKELMELLEKADDYSHKYRLGIVSGFLGIRNPLIQMFGVTSVMVENVNVNTVPGFPGRYQIEMTLCGFNKTQKRMEQLEGISPIYRDTTPASRNSRQLLEDLSQDVQVIEYRMRNIEAYPDLELPTYEELEAALPYIDKRIQTYPYKTTGKYVDPDFYISTQWTFREQIRMQRDKNLVISFKDSQGVEASTSPNSSFALDLGEEAAEIMKNVEKQAVKINPAFSWSGNVVGSTNQSQPTQPTPSDFENQEVADFILNSRMELLKPPTYEEWKKIGMGSDKNTYDAWLNRIKNGRYPSEEEVYKKIYELIDKYWVSKGLVYDERIMKEITGNESLVFGESFVFGLSAKKVVYANHEDFYKAYAQYLKLQNPLLSGNVENPKNLDVDDLAATNHQLPRERLANIIKAMLHVRSKWRQFDSTGRPRIDYKYSAGVAGVPLGRLAHSKEEAKRLLWDWEYNLETGIKSMFEYYEAASKMDDIYHKGRPWDWMIHGYDTNQLVGSFGSFFYSTYRAFYKNYNAYELRYATPSYPVNPKVFAWLNGYSQDDLPIIDPGDPKHRQKIIEDLLNAGYRHPETASKEETRRYLEGLSNKQLLEIYKDHFEFDFWDFISGELNEELTSLILNFTKEGERYDAFDQFNEAQKEANKLINTDSPQDLYYEMFTDMILYDQRGRLLRAFPTFCMFIVEEGQWLSTYRLWDNLYGFNAIASIDIHRSRLIAADTAVITMTNIYSNLTSVPADARKNEVEIGFWDNVWYKKDHQKIVEERKKLLTSMFLTPGARIHLRMGYGSNVADLPIVFNGTITEMDTQEVVTIVAQGDGIELTNIISGDPNDDNNGILHVTEPRDLLCELLTSKGNWLKDVINWATDNQFFQDNPLGIMHFGTPGETPPGNLLFFNNDYGEAAQNIYSSSGIPTYSQWVYQDGSLILPFSYDSPHWLFQSLVPGDEPNIIVPFYNNTVWDIAQTIAYCCPDYIAAVHPFELRSTLFFGKPYWKIAWRYDSRYEYDPNEKRWIRYVDREHRKPFMQFHYFDSHMDIISNKIKASEEGVYTCVVVNYDGKQAPTAYADYDIRFDKQKLAVVDAKIISRIDGLDFWTSEDQARYYGYSTLRDYMKNIYKGELLVLGDPTLKPHDFCYLNDTVSDMNGGFQVKAVTHHFSFETGFVSSIQPDMLALIDDVALVNHFTWLTSFGISLGVRVVFEKYLKDALRKIYERSIASKLYKLGKAKEIGEKVVKRMFQLFGVDDPDFKAYYNKFLEYIGMNPNDPLKDQVKAQLDNLREKAKTKFQELDKNGKVKNIVEKIKNRSVLNFLNKVEKIAQGGAEAAGILGQVAGMSFRVIATVAKTNVISAVVTVAVESLFEMYRRFKADFQCVIVWPMQYHGREFSAGITGHKGMVIGDDQMGKMDSLLSGMGFDGKEDWWNPIEWVFDLLNFLSGDDKKFIISNEDAMK